MIEGGVADREQTTLAPLQGRIGRYQLFRKITQLHPLSPVPARPLANTPLTPFDRR